MDIPPPLAENHCKISNGLGSLFQLYEKSVKGGNGEEWTPKKEKLTRLVFTIKQLKICGFWEHSSQSLMPLYEGMQSYV